MTSYTPLPPSPYTENNDLRGLVSKGKRAGGSEPQSAEIAVELAVARTKVQFAGAMIQMLMQGGGIMSGAAGPSTPGSASAPTLTPIQGC
jgi:hypothetical protein